MVRGESITSQLEQAVHFVSIKGFHYFFFVDIAQDWFLFVSISATTIIMSIPQRWRSVGSFGHIQPQADESSDPFHQCRKQHNPPKASSPNWPTSVFFTISRLASQPTSYWTSRKQQHSRCTQEGPSYWNRCWRTRQCLLLLVPHAWLSHWCLFLRRQNNAESSSPYYFFSSFPRPSLIPSPSSRPAPPDRPLL